MLTYELETVNLITFTNQGNYSCTTLGIEPSDFSKEDGLHDRYATRHLMIPKLLRSSTDTSLSYALRLASLATLSNDKVMVNECDKWIFFGDTLSKGKKNDHVFHNTCLTYIIRHYDGLRIIAGKQEIPSNIFWTDHCPT